MKQKILVTAYGEFGNNASIHIPGRNNPASAIQKDTLNSVIEDLRAAKHLLVTGNPADAEDELDGVIDRLNDIYERLSLETRVDFP
ncbi:DUF6959 family protein [Aquilutibacter rugosus]|uniref:DUF6959 family protein n=1 Tax=Aquilutibacter rugosus TaxID=3115820 RepID=UPI002F428D1E